MKDFDKQLGSRLKELRLYHGYTQKSIGLLLGVTFQQIQKYETGTNRITADTLHKLKTLYGIEWEVFFKTIRSPLLPALPVAEIELNTSTVQLLNSITSRRIRRSVHMFVREVAEMERSFNITEQRGQDHFLQGDDDNAMVEEV